jgi:hypothetical protein
MSQATSRWRLTAVSAVLVCGGASWPAGADYIPADSRRFTTWNPGLAAIGGIPHRTTVCATLDAASFGNGAQDASAAIQSAIDACPAGQVVGLSAGTFRVDDHLLIDKGITLRGAGPRTTVLRKTNGATPNSGSAPDAQPIVIVGPNRWPGPDDGTSRDLVADGAKGAFSVTVSNATGFAAGQIVLLDELSGASWQPDRAGLSARVWASADYRVTWRLHDPGLPGDDPLTPTTPTGGGAASWFCRRDRPTAELKEVAGVSGNVVTFTTPLHIDYRAGATHRAQLTRFTGGNAHVKLAGVEDLTVTGASDGAVRFAAAAYSWARNLEVTVWLGEGFAVDDSFRVEVRDSYVHDAAWASPGGAGYAISLANGSAEVLFENNISVRANKVMVARCAGAGSVFGYNYVDQGYIFYAPSWIEIGLNASHMVGPHHVLFEGNYGFNWDSDFTHGNSIFHTVFRNWLRGVRRPFTFTDPDGDSHTVNDATNGNAGPKRAVGAQSYSYWLTFVGNVLGAAGEMAGWIYDASGANGWGSDGIWLLGWDQGSFDPQVRATAIRDGNWDWVQGSQSWHDSSPVTLQNSLYLAGKPTFFGASPWPWVDPTTGVVASLPAQARFEALESGTPVSQVTVSGCAVVEPDTGDRPCAFTVWVTPGSDQQVEVPYATADGTAQAGVDYQAATGSLTFPPGTTSQQVPVAVFGDTAAGSSRRFFLDLGTPVNATLGAARGEGTITDNDQLDFYTLPPCRLVDSRTGPGEPLVSGVAQSFAGAGRCGVPATAKALVLNVTVVGPTHSGHLLVFPADAAPPLASTINFAAQGTRANGALVAVGTEGRVAARGILGSSTGRVHLVLDVFGYFE